MSAHDLMGRNEINRHCLAPCAEQLAGFDCPCLRRMQTEALEAMRELDRQSEAIRMGAERRMRERPS